MPSFPSGVHRIGGANSAPVHVAQRVEFYAPLLPVLAGLRAQGLSLRAIAAELNRLGIPTRHYSDGRWSATQVRRVLGYARAAGHDVGGRR
jgi:hypothetical protein